MGQSKRTSPAAEIQTPRLVLTRSTPGRLAALIHGPPEYERIFGHRVEHGYIEWPDMLVFSLEQARAYVEHQQWWLPYLMIHPGHDALVGFCGYKGPPDGDGFVEIGYGIAPAYRGQGFVSEVASALAGHALAHTGVTGVRAHTLPETSASTRILTKCGFVHTGDFQDPDDGRLWRWELGKKPFSGS